MLKFTLTPRLSGLDIFRPSKVKFFWCQGFFFREFEFQKWVLNEFQDNNEKS